MSEDAEARDMQVSLARLNLAPAAFGGELFTDEEIDAMRRHVRLAGELRGCRYFTEQERTMSATIDAGGTTNFDMSLPDAGATRDMLGVLRQLFGDGERGSFTKIVTMLREHADPTSPEGQALLDTLEGFEKLREGVLRRLSSRRGTGDRFSTSRVINATSAATGKSSPC
jgi:hypothetical protein